MTVREQVKSTVKKSVIASLFLILVSPVFGETYVCAFQCYISDELCQSSYERTHDGFVDDYDRLHITNENERYISLAFPYVGDDGAVVWSVVIDKSTLEFAKSTNALDGGGSRLGKCSVVQ